jgi:hypothetical protein
MTIDRWLLNSALERSKVGVAVAITKDGVAKEFSKPRHAEVFFGDQLKHLFYEGRDVYTPTKIDLVLNEGQDIGQGLYLFRDRVFELKDDNTVELVERPFDTLDSTSCVELMSMTNIRDWDWLLYAAEELADSDSDLERALRAIATAGIDPVNETRLMEILNGIGTADPG